MSKSIGIIPARYASTRFPGKPLAMINGMTMIQRVYEQVKKSQVQDVFVATDDKRIFDHVISFGGKAVMTRADHDSGTDRCLEAYDKTGLESDIIVNIQGDEPFIEPGQIDELISVIDHHQSDIATLAVPIHDENHINDPNKVKVVRDFHGNALYFSRSPIPFVKDGNRSQVTYFKHLGVYAFKTSVFRKLCSLLPSPLEKAESLEQLRWLENGYTIHVAETERETPAVDTPEDLEKLLASLK